MHTDEVLAKLRPWRERNGRRAWRPITLDEDGPRTVSKFSGVPLLRSNESWPLCAECHAPMPLFLQLDLSAIPSVAREQFGEGMLQLFYCTQCDGGWEPFSRVSLVRNLPQPWELSPGVSAECRTEMPPKRIVDWQEFTDYPHPPEHDDLGLTYKYDFKSKPSRTTVASRDPAFVAEGIVDDELAEKLSVAEAGDKLAGWPCWIQGVEYPSCPRCNARMRLVFQLDSEDHLAYMFGDVGTGHVTQCPEHRDVVAFGWACS